MLLLTNKRVGERELAERFEVSLRTIYRDLETLGGAGIPIVSFSGPNGGYEIMERFGDAERTDGGFCARSGHVITPPHQNGNCCSPRSARLQFPL
jgi:Fe2+ or Zn2+ uptake regulation protein